MAKLSELKQQFTEVTGAPANKANAMLFCKSGTTDGRSMRSKDDWEFANTNIERKMIAVQEEPPVNESVEEDNLNTKEIQNSEQAECETIASALCNLPSTFTHELAKCVIRNGFYPRVVKYLHPDTSNLLSTDRMLNGYQALLGAKKDADRGMSRIVESSTDWIDPKDDLSDISF
ncbi:MAG: hypothetical protein F6K53_20135 [Moorea sp. SIO4A1]|uniref:hypothetical protein n=1 Tax=Moorena sp. SIO4A1 TaxID=2607835 RepID=UPI001418ED2A|nr:hypothetical protein [Moorena sp. SIO4A1]NEO43290.1 hypothetical protein [Moorena sp. SIO4A3]NEQ59581.1 hypothetical protein [Moorena sp. SIO4A1]